MGFVEHPDRQEDDGQAGEERRLRPLEDVDPAPDEQVFAGVEQVRDVGAEKTDLAERPLEAVRVAQDGLITEEERQEQNAAGRERADDRRQPPPRPASEREPGQPERDQDRREEQKIAAGERLEHPRGSRDGHPAPVGRAIVAVERREADRRPVDRQHLDVRCLCEAIRGERERHRGHDRHVVPPGDRVGEEMRAQRAQRERRDQGDVVAEQRLVGEQDQRRRDRGEPEQVLRKRQDPRRRVVDRRVPPVRGQWHRLRAGPPQDPRVEERIAEVVGDARPQVDRQRPGIGDR